jgi:hypothetical protein
MHFRGEMVVVTEKMDGENTSLYSDKYHARSIDSRHHPSRSAVKGIWGRIKHMIPEGWRVVGENVYAKHSIFYNDLDSYFYVFAVWNDKNECLSWDETEEFAESLYLPTAPLIFIGEYDIKEIVKTFKEYESIRKESGNEVEGFVLRKEHSFPFDEFDGNIAKYVRKGHVQTSKFWMNEKITPNLLK